MKKKTLPKNKLKSFTYLHKPPQHSPWETKNPLYAIGLQPCLPFPPCSPGASLQSPGRSMQPGPPQLASPRWLGAAGWKSFWMVPRSPSPPELPAEAGEGFFCLQFVTLLWCIPLAFWILCIYFHKCLQHLSTLQQPALCARQKYQDVLRYCMCQSLSCIWVQAHPRSTKIEKLF